MNRLFLYSGGTFIIGNILYCGFHQYHIQMVNEIQTNLNKHKNKLNSEDYTSSMRNIQEWKKLSVFEQTTSLPKFEKFSKIPYEENRKD